MADGKVNWPTFGEQGCGALVGKTSFGQPPPSTPQTPYHGHPLFYEIVDELKALHSEKNRQYASNADPLGNFTRTGWMIAKMLKPGVNPRLASILAMVSKQIDAVYDMVGEGKKGTIDSLDDKLRDIAVYSILAMIVLREDVGQKGAVVDG